MQPHHDRSIMYREFTKRRRRTAARVAWAIALFLGLGGANHARADSDLPKVEFERYNLDNGIEVILHQDNRVPLVAVDVWYHVGAGNEVLGRSGFAHLFEHMLFQGSKNVGEDKHFKILKNIGVSAVNGSTNTDRTNYYEVVPSHELETALWLESDRMGYLLPLLTQKSFDNQIDVVRNERRQRIDNVPYGTTLLARTKALYPKGHPYRYTVIGRHKDLAAATLDDVRNFYKTWYVPGNATLVVAGDFERDTAKELITKWFGSFPKSERPELTAVPVPEITRKRVKVKDKFAKLRMLTYSWHTPAFMKEGDAELDILAHTLGASGTGRLYQSLVHKRQLAQSVSVYQESKGFSSAFVIAVQLRSGASTKQVARLIQHELARVQKQPITQREFDRAVTSVESSFVWNLESLLSRAELLQRYNHYVGTPDYIRQDLERYTKSTPEKVRKMAKKYLTTDHRVEILTVPDKSAGKKEKQQ
jgi:zinc protease